MTSPDELSPARLPSPRPAPLPFGLTWPDLEDVLPGAAPVGGRAVVSHSKRGPYQGGHPSTTMTLSHQAGAGPPRQQTLFFKQNPDGSREAARHRVLAERGIPVPRLAVCVEREREEVLGLELLPSVGLGPGDVDEVLRLVAALNALTDLPDGVVGNPPGLPQDEFEDLLGRALDEVAASHPDLAPRPWLDTYRRALALQRDLPTALTHGELAAQQLGRTEDGRLVVLDLATVGRRPRLADVANLLATLAHLSGRAERSVLRDYQVLLSSAGGPTVPEDRAWAELQLTRFVQGVEALPWRLGLGQSADLRQHLRQIAADRRAVLEQPRP